MRMLWMVALLSLSLVGNGLWAQKSKPANNLEAGLKGEYFNGPNFERKVMTRTDAQVNFNWNWQSPGPGVQREYFSVRWTGKLYAPTTGKYRFSATVDDGVRVWVNGKKVIDEWRKQDDSQFVGEISLNGKRLYDLRIEYYNDWKGSIISVYWESPDDSKGVRFNDPTKQDIPAQLVFWRNPIPAKYLFSRPDRLTVVTKPVPVAANRAVTLPAKPTTLKLTSNLAKRTVGPLSVAPATSISQPFKNLKAGEIIVFQYVTFPQGEYTLLPESYAELNKLVKALQANPAIRIEIAGHTDNVGDKRLNLVLSEFRAKVVASYLIRHGIADTRITAKGYGGSRPVTDNISEAKRAQNRRVEFTVIE